MSMSSGINLGDVHFPASAMTFEGFRRWVLSDACPEKLRVHFIEGEVFFDMSPESFETHSKVKGAIYMALETIGEEEGIGEAYPDGILVSDPAARVSCEPDVTFLRFDTLRSGRIKLKRKANRADDFVELVGAPDIVVEVISDSSTRKDLELLREAYARAGVPEYWLVDARKAKTRFEILVLQRRKYRNLCPLDEPQQSRVLRRRFALTRRRNEVGTFIYRLASLP